MGVSFSRVRESALGFLGQEGALGADDTTLSSHGKTNKRNSTEITISNGSPSNRKRKRTGHDENGKGERTSSGNAEKRQTRPPNQSKNIRTTRKRKLAFILGYDGAPYYGWQKNTGVTTVSDVVESAIFATGLISSDNYGEQKKTGWIAAARTDKGVSAAGNVLSLKVEIPKLDGSDSPSALAELVKFINSNLPKHVRVFRAFKVTTNFSARINCGERNYEYLLDSSAIGANNLARFNGILQQFECPKGKWFHNYTVGAAHSIPPCDSARRLMHSVKCDNELFHLRDEHGNVESSWVRIRIRGQSFMLHQIRKMISMAILVHQRRVPENTIELSMSAACLLNIPPAPPTGLFLDFCDFSMYNRRQANNLDCPVTHEEDEEERERFKCDVILPSIARRAQTRKDMEIFFAVIDEHAATIEQMEENVAKPRKREEDSSAAAVAKGAESKEQ